MKRLRKVLKNEKGQGMLEYVLLLAIVAVLIAAFRVQIQGIFQNATNQLTSKTNSVFQE